MYVTLFIKIFIKKKINFVRIKNNHLKITEVQKYFVHFSL